MKYVLFPLCQQLICLHELFKFEVDLILAKMVLFI